MALKSERISTDNLLFFRDVISDEAGFDVIYAEEVNYSLGIIDEEKNVPVGCICATQRERYMEIGWIYVDEEYRQQGHGERLLNAVTNFVFFETELEEIRLSLTLLQQEAVVNLYRFFVACDFFEATDQGVCVEFKKEDLVTITCNNVKDVLTFEEMNNVQRGSVAKRLEALEFIREGQDFWQETDMKCSVGLVAGNEITAFIWMLNYDEETLRIGAISGATGKGEDLMKICSVAVDNVREELSDEGVVICELYEKKQLNFVSKLTGGKLKISDRVINLIKAV